MEVLYPAGPAGVPPDLTKPSTAYRQRAWIATASLLLFVALYFSLAGWFAWTGYKLIDGARDAQYTFSVWLAGACSFFFAFFMLKALFFIEHARKVDDIEITAVQEPQLFAFLYQLADEAGAPRPHRVYVSARVNAAVFYDLSLLNLLLPSKKNLEIGLGLVNVLTLGEFKAVLAHEFGHFAQRSMAVGRWVYVAQQVAGHIIAKRDALDNFLRTLSTSDVRISWMGWLLSLVVWSIRSLLESAFHVVVLAQRALSREMEMQADLVAVSLTGSDALINALHRIQAADEAWDRTLALANSQLAKGRVPRDLFAVQRRVIDRMREILGNPAYGAQPACPDGPPEARRVFKAELAAPPRMWLTHPLNHEREDNAKRVYIPAPADERGAWALFADPAALCERVSAHLVPPSAAQVSPEPVEETLAAVDRQFQREYLNRRYRGAYLGRSSVRHAAGVAQLYAEPQGDLRAALQALYPESLTGEIEHLRSLEREKALLQALRDGIFTAPGGVIWHRGREIGKRELPRVIGVLEAELAAAQAQLWEHDRLCRGAHRAAARLAGQGWEAYLDGLVRVLHYADHGQAQLRDAQGMLRNVLNVATATRDVSAKDIKRILAAAQDLHSHLRSLFAHAGEMLPDNALAARLADDNQAAVLDEFKLPPPSEANLNEWLKAIDSWVDCPCDWLAGLERAALEQLLLGEAQMARHVLDGTPVEEAPAPAGVPAGYAVLTPGSERKRQTRLGWWARFQTAEGPLPALARLLAAGGIVGSVLGLGGSLGDTQVVVYNGLAREVRVSLGGATATLRPHAAARVGAPTSGRIMVEARTADGKLIETFQAEIERGFVHRVYNVAGASPLVEWTATYGYAQAREPRILGAPRWTQSSAGLFFEEPPSQISTKGGGGTIEVLSALADRGPGAALDGLSAEEKTRLLAAHVRWDAADSTDMMDWLNAAADLPDMARLLAARLADNPREVVSLRQRQDLAAAGRAAVCERDRAQAAGAPADGDLQYIATRCIEGSVVRDQAFIDGHLRFADNPWFGYAAGAVLGGQNRWREAEAALELARTQPALAADTSIDLARLRRLRGGDQVALQDLTAASESLRNLLALEGDARMNSEGARSYAELAHGRVDAALKIARRWPAGEARVLRLAAASDGAEPALAARALDLPLDAGLDQNTLWSSIGLALRERRDPAPYLEFMRKLVGRDAEALEKVIGLLRAGAAPASVDQALIGLPIYARAQVCSIGVILRGKNAPRAWRDTARLALFATERPYFGKQSL